MSLKNKLNCVKTKSYWAIIETPWSVTFDAPQIVKEYKLWLIGFEQMETKKSSVIPLQKDKSNIFKFGTNPTTYFIVTSFTLNELN